MPLTCGTKNVNRQTVNRVSVTSNQEKYRRKFIFFESAG
jgi:hypothetical protein